MEIIAGSTVMQSQRYSARAGSSTRTSNVVLLWASHPAATACVSSPVGCPCSGEVSHSRRDHIVRNESQLGDGC